MEKKKNNKQITKLADKDVFNGWEDIIADQKIYTPNEMKQKEDEIQEWKNKYLYLQADLQNIRKKFLKQIEDNKKYEGGDILKDLLPILDNLEFSMMDDIDVLNAYNALIKLLDKYGVKSIYGDERPVYFNQEYDEAISSVKTDDKNLDNSINKVYQKGYFFKDKILRFEKVIVNKYE